MSWCLIIIKMTKYEPPMILITLESLAKMTTPLVNCLDVVISSKLYYFIQHYLLTLPILNFVIISMNIIYLSLTTST